MYTIVFLENDNPLISKKIYSEVENKFYKEIQSDFPNYKTTLRYDDREKLLKFIIKNWGLDSIEIQRLNNILNSDETIIYLKDIKFCRE